MKTNNLYHQIKDQYLSRDYASTSCEIDFSQFETLVKFFPNDAFYIVDCRKALLHKISSNFGYFAKDNYDIIDEIHPLLNHIHEDHFEQFGKLTDSIVKVAARKNAWKPFEDISRMIYKAKNGRTYLKTMMPIVNDENGIMIFSLGRLSDVTDLIPCTGVHYEFCGPNELSLYAAVNSMEEFEPVLGKREIQILEFVGKGYSSKSIGEILSISKNTVDTHRRNIIHKLEANGCIEAYNKARDMGLLQKTTNHETH